MYDPSKRTCNPFVKTVPSGAVYVCLPTMSVGSVILCEVVPSTGFDGIVENAPLDSVDKSSAYGYQ